MRRAFMATAGMQTSLCRVSRCTHSVLLRVMAHVGHHDPRFIFPGTAFHSCPSPHRHLRTVRSFTYVSDKHIPPLTYRAKFMLIRLPLLTRHPSICAQIAPKFCFQLWALSMKREPRNERRNMTISRLWFRGLILV